ncbi:TPA: hypothetical protein SMO97_000846 [Proteus mirabilis]|nr:hypothetical protein [Proteus mirabilis]
MADLLRCEVCIKLVFNSIKIFPELIKDKKVPNVKISFYGINDGDGAEELIIHLYIEDVENKTIRDIHEKAETELFRRINSYGK